MARTSARNAASTLAIIALAACGGKTPANIEAVSRGESYQAQYRDLERPAADSPTLRSALMNAARCKPYSGSAGAGKLRTYLPDALRGELLSRGDLIDLRVPNDETFTGEFVVSRDGMLKIPFLDPIPAQGRRTEQVAAEIRRKLGAGGFYIDEPALSLLVMDFAPVRIGVSGAVFDPQASDIGGVQGDQVDSRRQAALGASTEGRNLSVALRSAGGVRPDADLSAVRITRAGTTHIVDSRGAVAGRHFDDIMLVTGDEVYVPSRQCFQDELMTPSPVSPPGVSLYLSNLTQPANNNAAAAVSQGVREVPYGTRYLQAVIDANCVGGARATSADRSAALFSRNPVTGVSVVIERRVEELRTRADRDDYDPYVLPGDAIACYDSGVTNLGEIGRLIGVFTLGALVD